MPALAMNQRAGQRDETRSFGWCGLFTRIPSSWRLYRVLGKEDNGSLRLSDEEAVRLDFAWGRIARRRFDPEQFVRRRLRKSTKSRPAELEKLVEPVQHEALKPLLYAPDPEKQLQRWVGYAPATGRLIEIVHHHHDDAPNPQVAKIVIPALIDQPLNAPRKWAFFSVALTTPAEFTYETSQMNMGDMSLTVARKRGWLRHERLTVRQIYPSALALSRRDLRAWMGDFVKQNRKLIRPDKRTQRFAGEPAFEELHTKLGQGLRCPMHLRRPIAALLWSYPRRFELDVLHDERHDRLVVLHIGARPGRLAPLRREVLSGLHWTRHED